MGATEAYVKEGGRIKKVVTIDGFDAQAEMNVIDGDIASVERQIASLHGQLAKLQAQKAALEAVVGQA